MNVHTQAQLNVHSAVRIDDESSGGRFDASTDRDSTTGLSETHKKGPAAAVMFRHRRPGIERVPHPLLPTEWDACRLPALHGAVRKAEHRVCQSRLVVNRVDPYTASTSFRSVSVNPTLASTRREAVFQLELCAFGRTRDAVLGHRVPWPLRGCSACPRCERGHVRGGRASRRERPHGMRDRGISSSASVRCRRASHASSPTATPGCSR